MSAASCGALGDAGVDVARGRADPRRRARRRPPRSSAAAELGATRVRWSSARDPKGRSRSRRSARRSASTSTIRPFGDHGPLADRPERDRLDAARADARSTMPYPEPSGREAVLLDVVYDPWPSALATSWARAGGTVVSGLGMLLHQALAQVRIFVTGDDVGDAAATRPRSCARHARSRRRALTLPGWNACCAGSRPANRTAPNSSPSWRACPPASRLARRRSRPTSQRRKLGYGRGARMKFEEDELVDLGRRPPRPEPRQPDRAAHRQHRVAASGSR